MINIKDKVYVIDWDKKYSSLTKQVDGQRVNLFPFKTELPVYYGIDSHWEYKYEPNLTLKGTVNKREPRKLVSKTPVYKDYKWEVLEIFKHPKAGKLHYDLDQYTQEQLDSWKDTSRYTEENLLLLASTHTDKDWMRCYIVAEESGVSYLTPEQFADEKFNALIEYHLGKWDRSLLITIDDKKKIPEEIISKFYDQNDNVLFGSRTVKGLVSYKYLEGKFSTDGKPIYIGVTINYDGKGNAGCDNPELIKPFNFIKSYIEQE